LCVDSATALIEEFIDVIDDASLIALINGDNDKMYNPSKNATNIDSNKNTNNFILYLFGRYKARFEIR